ncbi:unnamed protein product [Cuscuta epithymum]|uniref:RNase H type-1 domain-containing protein n=1 Tax=Cuscuta epithymum TaxID=186058 RepID=A0AAV0CFJ5_9ASTE|nr:unnamed protein product [Cuscuta epithymum]
MEAELKAVHQSILMALDNGFKGFEVEMDSRLIVDGILGGGYTEGRWKRQFEDLRRWMVSSKLLFRHIPRDINWPAHYLSKIVSDNQVIFHNIRQLPGHIRRTLIADKLGLSYFRLC